MPRFYFDTSHGSQQQVRDGVGRLFDTIAEARAHAMSTLPLVTSEPPMQDGEFRTWTATVRDDNGDLVGRFILAFVADAIATTGNRVLRPD